jgi:cytochrome P450
LNILASLTPELVKEADFAFQKELGEPQSKYSFSSRTIKPKFILIFTAWKTINAFMLSAMLTNRTSGRVLVGDLCRDMDYLQAVMKYSEGVFFTGIAFNGIPLGPFRKLAYWLAATPHRQDIKKAAAILLPVLEKRVKSKSSMSAPENDMIQWNLDSPLASPKEGTMVRHAQRILHLSFAATGTVTILITHMIYTLLMHPEYLEPLREEIEACVAAKDGWSEKAMSDMWKLDSFIRETLRTQPPSVCTSFFHPKISHKICNF